MHVLKKLLYLFLFLHIGNYCLAQTNLRNNEITLLANDFNKWYDYTIQNINLSSEFIAIDTGSSEISKELFYSKLMNGKYIILKNTKNSYQLFAPDSIQEDIKLTISSLAYKQWQYLKMEGTLLPDFSFKDINGYRIDSITRKGKITLIKCWFISCVACIKEFPKLNNLVNKYKNDSSIQFVSLAFDEKEALINFLKKRKFKYAVIPSMKNYIMNELKLIEFPTHILVDGNGRIVKVTNQIEEIIPFLETQLNQ